MSSPEKKRRYFSNRNLSVACLLFLGMGNAWPLIKMTVHDPNFEGWMNWRNRTISIVKFRPLIIVDLFTMFISAVVYFGAMIYLITKAPSTFLFNKVMITVITVVLWGLLYSIFMVCSEFESMIRQDWPNVMMDCGAEDYAFFTVLCPVFVKLFSIIVFFRYMMEVKRKQINKSTDRTDVNNEEADFTQPPTNNILPSDPPYPFTNESFVVMPENISIPTFHNIETFDICDVFCDGLV